jgi:hypothetical protein
MFSFKSIGHFFASVAHDIVKVSRIAAPVVAKVAEAEPTVEAISQLIYPEAVPLERGAFQLLGMAAEAISAAGDAVEANGINLTLDKNIVADIKALIPAIENYAKRFGVSKPSAAPVPAPGA